jgi:predicted nuclease of predicted toxin-antitoxin system
LARFLVDESLPRAVTRALSEAGHDTLDVRDIGLRGATDSVIAAHALAEGRVLVAGDTDFANALRFPPATHPGIVVLRLPNAFAPEERAKRLLSALDPSILSTLAGSIVIVEVARVRVLSVPITP